MAFRAPTPLTQLPRFPVTGVVGVAAIALTVAWWARVDLDILFMDARAWYGQPWRLATSALPHVDVFHLALNVYWLWVFGTLVEGTLGRWATAGLMLLFAVGSVAAEYALFRGGVGLSGVGYGLFGLLWVLSRHDSRFEGAIDARTSALFLGWFVLCCVLTWAGVWRVANVAHAAGAFFGAMLGLAMTAPRKWLAPAIGLLVVTLVLSLLGGSLGRRYVNVAGQPGQDMAAIAHRAGEQKDDSAAIVWYRRALAENPGETDWWHNLGVTYLQQQRPEEAVEAFERAHELNPSEKSRSALLYARQELARGR